MPQNIGHAVVTVAGLPSSRALSHFQTVVGVGQT